MAKYRVMYKSTDYVYLDVEADSWKEAKRIADQWNKDFQANGKQKPSSEW